MARLELKGLAKSFKNGAVLDGVSLAADAGEIVVIFGPSGTGKTLLLRLIAGIYDADQGAVFVDGEDMTDVAPDHRGIGMAFQNFALFPHMSAFDNIASPLAARHLAPAAIRDGVERVARLLKIDQVLAHAPRELSNGQKQRTALARALAGAPKLLLLDDPLRNVDAKLRFEMRLELPPLLRQSGSTVLYVTQDYKEAMALADRIAVLIGGRFVQVASPDEIYRLPETVQVARLFGDPTINLIEVTPHSAGNGVAVTIGNTTVPIGEQYRAAAGSAALLGIRPEAIRIGAVDAGAIAADVVAVTPLNERLVTLLKTADGHELLASQPAGERAAEADSKVGLQFMRDDVLLFDRASGQRLKAANGAGAS
ncbi:MAG TPA: ABC transporter ATP-binding protein [Candidatus Acidoferrum sp.]|nr:ABC transporter ATP-binding protein [Candidatus Acidoferrum sp.]